MAPAHGAPACPAYLDAVAREEWARVVPQLAELGVLTKVDGGALEGYCAAYSQAVAFQKKAAAKPMVTTPWGPKPNPAAGEARKAWSLVKQFAGEFGLTPSARTRVSGPAGKKPAGEPQSANGVPLVGPGLRVLDGGIGG